MAKSLLQQVMMKPEKEKQILDTKSMIEKINSGYLAGRGTDFKTKKTFAPSTLVYNHGECPRYWYLAFSGANFEDNVDAYAVANMSSGTMSHERIEKAIEGSGLLIDKEFKVTYNDPPIFGFGDVLLEWEGEQVVGEIKTSNHEAFEYRKKSNTPKDYHLKQLLLYMKILNKGKGVLIYENKNNHELFLYPVEVKPEYVEWVDNTFEWMRTVRKAWENKQLPIKNYRSNSKICKGCPLFNDCTAAGAGDIKIDSLEDLSEAL